MNDVTVELHVIHGPWKGKGPKYRIHIGSGPDGRPLLMLYDRQIAYNLAEDIFGALASWPEDKPAS